MIEFIEIETPFKLEQLKYVPTKCVAMTNNDEVLGFLHWKNETELHVDWFDYATPIERFRAAVLFCNMEHPTRIRSYAIPATKDFYDRVCKHSKLQYIGEQEGVFWYALGE